MFIIIKLIANKPLKPSIKLAPFITNKKQSSTNIEENIWLDIKGIKNGMSIFKTLIGNMYMNIKRRITININLSNGLILILMSSKKPTIKTEKLTKI